MKLQIHISVIWLLKDQVGQFATNAARRYFDLAYQANPEDTTALSFLHRVHHHIINGLPDDWSGVEMMVTK